MATWQEVENYLTSNYELDVVEPEVLKLVFGVGDGRSQMVFVMGMSLDDPDLAHVSFISPFARTEQLSPQQLVNTMADNTALGITSIGGWYALKHVAPLANLDANEIEWPLTFVTGGADMLERQLGLGDDL